MITSLLFSATLTFTATATGLEKGAPVEFFLAGPTSDRDYESMFILDESVASFCKRVEAVAPRGSPVDSRSCRLWPTGCRVRFEPSFDRFVDTRLVEGESPHVPIFTGGARLTNDVVEADSTMPSAVYATYSLPQSPIVFETPVNQGTAYGRHTAAVKLEKGKKITFTLTIDENSAPRKLELTAESGNLQQVLRNLKEASANGDVDAQVSFSDSMTVSEAQTFARALSIIDSSRVKLNGARGLFYQAFLPLEKWRERQERLQQPFELTLFENGTDRLVFIDEDWTVEGDDPKLTPRQISYEEAKRYPRTETCFIFASKTQTISRIKSAILKFPHKQIVNWYIFSNQ